MALRQQQSFILLKNQQFGRFPHLFIGHYLGGSTRGKESTCEMLYIQVIAGELVLAVIRSLVASLLSEWTSSRNCFGFLTKCQLGSKSNYSKRKEVEANGLLRLGPRNLHNSTFPSFSWSLFKSSLRLAGSQLSLAGLSRFLGGVC